MLKYLIFLYALAGIVTIQSKCTLNESDPKKEAPLNIILINADDLGAHSIEPYGQEIIKTPRLNQMVEEGVIFENAYSSASMCCPSRSSLLLGKHLGHLKERSNGGNCHLAKDELCFPEILQKSGYKTAMFGKKHDSRYINRFNPIDDTPSDNGFDYFVGSLGKGESRAMFLDGVTHGDNKRPSWLWQDSAGVISKYPIAPDRYTQNEYMSLIENYLRDNRDSTFFLYFSSQIPHFEHVVPKPGHADFHPDDKGLYEQYLDKDGKSIFKETPYKGSIKQALRHEESPKATYAALVSRLDRDVGKILDLLKELKIAENTMVIFTSDNGPSWVFGGDVFDQNGPLKAGKGRIYEGGLKVPMILWGGKTPRKKVITKPVVHYDIANTILDLCQVKEEFNSDGLSWRPLVFEQDDKPFVRDHLYWENYGYGSNKAAQAILLQDRYKCIQRFEFGVLKKVELYDLSTDPGESKNLSTLDDYKNILEQAQQIMIQEHVPNQKFYMN